jgi:hypothetical protein
VSACAIGAFAASPALTLASESPPWAICDIGQAADEGVAQHGLRLEPANGATVPAGTPVTFPGESSVALTFSVASSEALLSSPDIDSGMGSQSGVSYKLSSAKATATPRTIYWAASFTVTPLDCESPSTYTTPVRTLIVVPSEAELAAAKKQQEEAAAEKKLEEEASAKKKEEETAATGTVVLDSLTIEAQSGRAAAVKLTCADVATCAGKLELSATTDKGKTRRARTASIGTASFSIAAGEESMIKLTLDRIGRALVSAAHGHLNANLTILRTAPLPSETQTQRVILEQQKKAKQGIRADAPAATVELARRQRGNVRLGQRHIAAS